MERRTQRKKPKRVKYYVFNIKLRSNLRSGTEAYKNMFIELFRKKIMKPVPHDKEMILRTQFLKVNEGKEFFTGKISKFTKIDNKDWINLDNLEIEEVAIPANRFPNLKETDYVFVPSAHRFAIVKKVEVTVPSVLAFLTDALQEIIMEGEYVDVIVQQANNVFEEILNANSIEKLKIEISYTNDDIVEGAEEFMDELLKGAGIGKLTIEAKADHNRNINVTSEVIGGALLLAKSNGSVEAKIVDNQNKKQLLRTEEYPEEFVTTYLDAFEESDSIARDILNEYRNE
ncbi:protein of unknown function [Chitinophaga jiangningensis]|uniref:DUF4747 domain-containing protein n=1 Tax=Chitinophaga jiangningensis TaxID=1419482 RepID=A0A1M7CKE0_9BACT|nr:DUF4747 family protein [Chitinophaga jiangningensis]SHL67603.1 protein of unknown function [Chitinophaga jiangningensis]